jgi:hypothetical protein
LEFKRGKSLSLFKDRPSSGTGGDIFEQIVSFTLSEQSICAAKELSSSLGGKSKVVSGYYQLELNDTPMLVKGIRNINSLWVTLRLMG